MLLQSHTFSCRSQRPSCTLIHCRCSVLFVRSCYRTNLTWQLCKGQPASLSCQHSASERKAASALRLHSWFQGRELLASAFAYLFRDVKQREETLRNLYTNLQLSSHWTKCLSTIHSASVLENLMQCIKISGNISSHFS